MVPVVVPPEAPAVGRRVADRRRVLRLDGRRVGREARDGEARAAAGEDQAGGDQQGRRERRAGRPATLRGLRHDPVVDARERVVAHVGPLAPQAGRELVEIVVRIGHRRYYAAGARNLMRKKELARERFERMYREHARALFAYIRWQCGDDALAEDLMADVFERALRSAHKYDPDRGERVDLALRDRGQPRPRPRPAPLGGAAGGGTAADGGGGVGLGQRRRVSRGPLRPDAGRWRG